MSDNRARDAAVFFHQNGSSPCIATLVSAQGLWLTDDAGNRYMDFHGNTSHHIGHAHPRLVAALKAQMDELAFAPRRYANTLATELAENLTGRFRSGKSRLLLMPGGNEAIETAIRLARIATGRSGIISFEGSYHGHGLGCLGLSSAHIDRRLGSHLPDIHHITPYWDQSGAEASLMDLERTLAVQGKLIACFVAEPMRSNCHVPPKQFWQEASRLCHKAGVKLVFDEIPSGLGKTGRFFAHEHFDVTPDLVVLGKALGGGMLPVAAVIGADDLNIAPELKVGHFTHEKNPLLARAALTTLQIIDDEKLVEQAKLSADYLETRVKELAGQGTPICLRGLGLLRAVEITDQRIDANMVVSELLQLGVSCDAKDAHSLGFSPPLSIARHELDNALSCVAKALIHKLS